MRTLVHNYNADDRQFVANCRWVAETLGEICSTIVGVASEASECFRYEDAIVKIEISTSDRACSVTGKGLLQGGVLKVANPVLCLNKSGDVVRWHAEGRGLYGHLNALVATNSCRGPREVASAAADAVQHLADTLDWVFERADLYAKFEGLAREIRSTVANLEYPR